MNIIEFELINLKSIWIFAKTTLLIFRSTLIKNCGKVRTENNQSL